LEVARRGYDITIDVREVEGLGAEGIETLARVSRMVQEWPTGVLYIIVAPSSPVQQELVESELAYAAKHPRLFLTEAGRKGESS
jgi:hypothetical protein